MRWFQGKERKLLLPHADQSHHTSLLQVETRTSNALPLQLCFFTVILSVKEKFVCLCSTLLSVCLLVSLYSNSDPRCCLRQTGETKLFIPGLHHTHTHLSPKDGSALGYSKCCHGHCRTSKGKNKDFQTSSLDDPLNLTHRKLLS